MLRNRTDILTHVLDRAPIQVWGVDEELNLTYLDGRAVRSHLTEEAQSLVGAPLASILPEDTTWVLERHRQAFAGEDQSYEVHWHDVVFWVHLRAPGPSDRREVAGIAVDITELHVARKRVDEAERMEHFAVEAADAGYWQLDLDPERPEDLDRARLHLSPKVLDFIGFEPGEGPATVSEWRDRILERDRQGIAEAAAEHLAGRAESYGVEYRIRHRDGSLRWIRSHGKIGRDEAGRPVRWAGLDLDVTEERRIEARWEHLFHLMDHPLVYQDAGGVVTEVNEAAAALLGRSADDLLGREPAALGELFVDERGSPVPLARHPALRALRERRVVSDSELHLAAVGKGSPRRLRMTSVPRLGPEGEPVEVFTSVERVDGEESD